MISFSTFCTFVLTFAKICVEVYVLGGMLDEGTSGEWKRDVWKSSDIGVTWTRVTNNAGWSRRAAKATGRAELRALKERILGAYRFSKRFAARPLVDGLYVCSGLFENSANSGNIGQIPA